MSSAQTIEELKKQKEFAEAEKAATEAQIALIESKKKLNDALAQPTTAEARREADINAANAAKATAEAEKGQTEAELAALKAKLAVPSSGISGSVTANSGAAVLETALLASRATTDAATRMANLIMPSVSGKNVYIFSTGDLPDFQAALAIHVQQMAVETALNDAARLPRPGKSTGQESGYGRESAAAVGLALEAASKLVGFFKSDFTVAGTDATADNQLLQQAFAGILVTKGNTKGVYLYSLYYPMRITANKLPGDLDKLTAPRNSARDLLGELEVYSSNLTKKIQDLDTTTVQAKAEKAKLENELKSNDGKIAQVRAALAAYDSFIGRFYAADSGGATMIRQGALLSALTASDSVLVVMKVNKAGGSNYIEKNLWTSFGAMPFKVAGGVVASFSAFEAATGRILASQTIEVHGGYSNVNRVGEIFSSGTASSK